MNKGEMPRIYKVNNRWVVVLPELIQKFVVDELKFDLEILSMPVNPTVPEFIEHITMQSPIEAYLNSVAISYKEELENSKELFNMWYNNVSYQNRTSLIEKYRTKFTEKLLENYLYNRYNDDILTYKKNILKCDTNYRYSCSIRDAFINKGQLLRTLKVFLMPENSIKL